MCLRCEIQLSFTYRVATLTSIKTIRILLQALQPLKLYFHLFIPAAHNDNNREKSCFRIHFSYFCLSRIWKLLK